MFTRLGALLRRPEIKTQSRSRVSSTKKLSYPSSVCAFVARSSGPYKKAVMDIFWFDWEKRKVNLRSASWVESCCTSFWVWSNWKFYVNSRWCWGGTRAYGETNTWPWRVFNSFCSPSASSTCSCQNNSSVDVILRQQAMHKSLYVDLQGNGSQAWEPVKASVLSKEYVVKRTRGGQINTFQLPAIDIYLHHGVDVALWTGELCWVFHLWQW